MTAKQPYKEVWTENLRQYVVEQIEKGRTISDIAKELYVAPATLRSAMRYYGHLKTKSSVVKYHKHTGNNVWVKRSKTKREEKKNE